jgi:hypothetical protein
MTPEILTALARHTLTIVAGLLAAKGYADKSDLDQVVGLLVGLIGVAWSIHHKWQVRADASPAASPPPPTPQP